jgi:hypothetical protein
MQLVLPDDSFLIESHSPGLLESQCWSGSESDLTSHVEYQRPRHVASHEPHDIIPRRARARRDRCAPAELSGPGEAAVSAASVRH